MAAVDAYRGAGVALAVAGSLLAAATYFTLGLDPLLALWLGMIVVGTSMALTPPPGVAPRAAASMVVSALESLSQLLEALGVGSTAVYAAYGGRVYVYVAPREPERVPREPPSSALADLGGAEAVVLLSPVQPSLLGASGSACEVVERVVVELLEAADSVACVDEGEVVAAEFANPRYGSPGRAERVLGSLYAAALASAAAVAKSSPAVVVEDREEGGRRRVVVRVRGW